MNSKSVKFSNPRTGEIWICENIETRRKIDGADFVEVYRPGFPRKVWMNMSNLVKVQETKKSKKVVDKTKQ